MRPLAALFATLIALGLTTAAALAQTGPESVPVAPTPQPAPPSSTEPGIEPAGGGSESAGSESADGGRELDADRRGRGGKGRGNRGKVRLLRADAKPSKAWFKGRPATFRYTIDGRRRRNLVIQVKRKGDAPKIVRRFERKDVRPGKVHEVKWDGHVDGGRKYARQGNYKFKVRVKHGGAANAKGAAGKAKAAFYTHKFPVRGGHSYGDGLGAGRGHRGVDVFARCGTKLQAARAGKVQYRAFQGSGAGHYLVIDGKKDRKDYVYMHLQKASRHQAGEKVRTGESIGRVGETGNATGCHLHFELWSSPGWYEGGQVLDPVPKLHAWDRFS